MTTMITLLFVVLGLGAAVLLVFGLYAAAARVTVRMTRAFHCPFRDRDVVATFLEDQWGGRPMDVERCSAFTPSTAIACEKPCLDLPSLPTVKAPEPAVTVRPISWF
ncbi:MAG: hypothetical protein HY216_11185 [Candidatus Rokubacteria bacterium]|nr:hypothetical protein [Candidatus Rokubacteria bacterium]